MSGAAASRIDWQAEYRDDDGTVAFRIGRCGDEVVAEWIDLARLTAHRDGSAFTFEPLEDAPVEEVEKIRRGSAMLLVRHLRGHLALHGAVVARDGGAVALVGRSRHGKSTLAAALCARGASLLADDAIAVERRAAGAWVVDPTEENHWLDAAARSALGDSDAGQWEEEDKWATRAPSVATRPVALRAVVELVFAPGIAGPSLVRTRGLDAIASLVPQTVRFALDDDERHKTEIAMLFELLGEVPSFRLERPQDLARLGESVALVEGLLSDGRRC